MAVSRLGFGKLQISESWLDMIGLEVWYRKQLHLKQGIHSAPSRSRDLYSKGSTIRSRSSH